MKNSWHRIVLAFLPVVGLASFAGASVLQESAEAAPVNLISNGSFEETTAPTSTFSTVFAGDSTTITGWTVVTPSLYGESGGSVDLVANSYWNAEDGNYSIDLAGTSSEPGGLYQDVPTTVGEQYMLTYWTAVNGDETSGVAHTMNVSANGATVATVQAVSAGRPLKWVEQNTTITATSSSTLIEFDDATPGDTTQGPTLDNVSMTAIPDTLTAAPVTIAPQTTGSSFTAPVATFTDSYLTSPADFSASIAWGDSTTSAGTISQSGSSFTVTGAHTYTVSATYTPVVTITSVTGGSATVSDSVTAANAVTMCAASGCSGTVTTPSETVGITSTSTSGTILTDVSTTQGSFSCGDIFRHAPAFTYVTDTGLNANLLLTVTFANSKAAGSWLIPFAICYQSPGPFTDVAGKSVTTGLLPICGGLFGTKPVVAPCVQSISELPFYLGNVVEKILVPAGDPRAH